MLTGRELSHQTSNRWQAGAGFLGANAVGEFDTFVPDSAPGMFGHVDRSLGPQHLQPGRRSLLEPVRQRVAIARAGTARA